jgi:hypothetical protein
VNPPFERLYGGSAKIISIEFFGSIDMRTRQSDRYKVKLSCEKNGFAGNVCVMVRDMVCPLQLIGFSHTVNICPYSSLGQKSSGIIVSFYEILFYFGIICFLGGTWRTTGYRK